MKPCRKCGELNPQSNQYCLSCGILINISTAMIKAQPKAIVPFVDRFQFKWVFLGLLTMIGANTVAIIITFAISMFVYNKTISTDLFSFFGVTVSDIAIIGLVLVLSSFIIGGLLIARLSKGRTTIETIIAAILAVLSFGSFGLIISEDAIIAAFIFILPCLLLAALGNWLETIKK